jgi:hypothetical protein
MARIISGHLDDPVPTTPGVEALFVRGRRYANTAAKFWASLVDEILEDTPACSRAELTALTAGPLSAKFLHPESALQDSLADLLTQDLREVMREMLAELEIVGPPGSVTVRLLDGETELLARPLPLDCVDADIFPCLLVWPLEWAGIARSTWNNEFVNGDFAAEDRRRGLLYQLSFDLRNTHVSEGLYRRCLSVSPAVCPMPSPAVGAPTEPRLTEE